MTELEKRYELLVLENNRLRAEVDKLRANQMQHCRGCRVCVPHKCGAFWWCFRYQISVDPDIDGCMRRRT